MISFEIGNSPKIDQWWNLKVMEVGCMWCGEKMKLGGFKELSREQNENEKRLTAH